MPSYVAGLALINYYYFQVAIPNLLFRQMGVLASLFLHLFERLRDVFEAAISEELKRSLGNVLVITECTEIRQIGVSIIRAARSFDHSRLPLEVFWSEDVARTLSEVFSAAKDSQAVKAFDEVAYRLPNQDKSTEK